MATAIRTATMNEEERTMVHMVTWLMILAKYDDHGKSAYIAKWKNFLKDILPDDVISTEYGDDVVGVLMAYKVTDESKITRRFKPKGKRYYLAEVIDRKKLDKILKDNAQPFMATLMDDIEAFYDSVEYNAEKANEKRKMTLSKMGF